MKLLIIEDESVVAMDLESQLLSIGHTVIGVADNYNDAIDFAGKKEIDLALLDINIIGDKTGLDIAREYNSKFNIPCVFITALSNERTIEGVKSVGAYGYIIKPFTLKDLQFTIEVAYNKYKNEQLLKTQNEQLETLVEERVKELKKSEEKLKFQNEILEKAQGIGNMGHWELDVPSGKLYWSKQIYSIFNFSVEDFEPTYDTFLSIIHPDDRDAVNEAYMTSLEKKLSYEIEHRLLLKNGTIRYVIERCETIYNNSGEAIKSIGTVQDITKDKKAELKLKESEEKFKSIFNSLIDVYYQSNAEGVIVEISPSVKSLSGYERHELLGETFSENFAFDIPREEILNELKKNGGVLKNYPLSMIHKNGKKRCLEVNITSLYDENNQFAGSEGVARDVTDRKAAELEINKLSMVVNQSPASVVITDLNGDIEYVNPSFESVTGYSMKEVIGKNPSVLSSGNMSDSHYKSMWETISNGESWYGEFENRKKNGELYWENVTISPIKNGEGTPYAYVGVKQDITQNKRDKEKLVKSIEETAEIKNALDQSSMVTVTDIKGVIIYVNDKFCKTSKYSQKELLGKTHKLVNSGYHSKKFFKDMWETISNGVIWKGEVKNKTKSGKYYWIDTIIVPSLDNRGRPTKYISIRKNITHRKKTEELLEQERKKTLQAQFEGEEREKDRVAKELHDGLGQILTAAKLSISALGNKGGHTKTTLDQLKDIKGLINEANVETQQIARSLLPRVLEDYGLTVAVERVLQEINTTLTIEACLKMNAEINVCKRDQIAAYRIIQEALNNAIKYSNCKRVEVEFDLQDDFNVITVSDDGCGFDTLKITDGLGLRNMKQRAKSIDGELMIQSEKDKGTSVVLKFICSCGK